MQIPNPKSQIPIEDGRRDDKGVRELCRRIGEDAGSQAAEILARAGEKVSGRLAQAARDAERSAGEVVGRAEEEASLESKRVLSRVQLESRRMELQGREALITEVVRRLREEIRTLRDRAGYRDCVKRLIVDGARQLGGKTVEILIAERDRGLVNDAFLREAADDLARAGAAGASLAVADETIEGTGAVVRSGRVEIDNTLEGRIARASRELRLLISKVLFG
jgi:vacuolar-type H+-ATPase subunit E/Vma4